MNLNQTTGYLPVVAALLGNIIVMVIKFLAALLSGSVSMFSEAVHSLADTLNQTLLIIGLRRSLKKPDQVFTYGYGYERFFWALISACGIFFIGAGITVYRGVTALLEPAEIVVQPLVFVVLLIAFMVESTTFLLAARELKRHYPDLSRWQRLRAGDPSTLAVFLEDGLAVLGVMIATTAISLTYLTGSTVWDAVGSIIIGLFLGVAAVVLIMKNRGYLIGKSIPESMQEKIIELLEADPAIEKVLNFQSNVLDVGVYRVKCEIEFNGSVLLKEIYKNSSLRAQYQEVKDDYEEFKKFCVDYADRIPRLVGRRIDDVETTLKKDYPGIKYIDIEIN